VTVAGVSFAIASNPGVESADLVLMPRDAAVDALQGAVRARPRPETDLFDLTYVSTEPRTARRILSAVMTEFQAQNALQAQQQSRRRRLFLEQQLRETDAVLAENRAALTGYRRERGIFSSQEEFSSQQQGLDAMQIRREELEADRQISRTLLAAAQRRRDAGSLRALVSAPAVSANPVIVDLYEQLVRYEAQRDSLTSGPFPSAQSNPDVQRLNALAAATQEHIADAVRSQISSLDARIAALDALLGRREGRLQDLPAVVAEELRLAQQLASTQAVADQLRTELQKARIAEAVEVGQVEVVDPASLPVNPMPQHRGARVFFGLLLGLTMGGVGALVRDRTNTSIRSREQLEQALGVSTLAVIPHISVDGERKRKRGWRLRPGRDGAGEGTAVQLAASEAAGGGAEAYRTLRTNLLFSQTRRLRTLVITSSGPAEGKTTTSANLAATFAQQGMQVALLDCDLRRPRLHEVFGVSREPGLTQIILGYSDNGEAVLPTPVEKLFLVTSGTLPPNPSELLGSERMREVLEELRARFDMVILDTPPVLVAPDASVLAASADGVLMVVRAGVTERGAAHEAAQQLRTVGGNLVGTVLNDPDAKLPGYGGYGKYRYSAYGYGYGYRASSNGR
jgi:tyrosine-protein kinase Etk/Wzc